ncbi:MAG: hypothetical protein Q8P07_00240 [bacterium]|nr:hypothetical protein [bacterium]
MTKNVDYARLVRALGFAERRGDEKEINKKVLHFLNQSFHETVSEFKEKLEKAKEEVRNIPLDKFRKPSDLESAWMLADLPLPLEEWDFLRYTDPEKTGIVCGEREKKILFSADSFKPFDLFGRREDLWGNAVWDLHYSLLWWREAVMCVWAGIIVKNLINCLKKKPTHLLSAGKTDMLQDAAANRLLFRNKPIGSGLNLDGISDEEADNFHRLCERARLGSYDCELSAAAAFKEWLRSANINVLQKYGLNNKEAHLLLFAGSQQRPQIDIDLCWDEGIRTYQFVCFVNNNDVHGYKDKEKTGHIPVNVLFDFFENAPLKTKEDLFRLVIRGGWDHARGFLDSGLVHHIN